MTKSVFIKSTFTEEILVIQTLYQQSGPSKYDSGDDDNDDDDDDDDDDDVRIMQRSIIDIAILCQHGGCVVFNSEYEFVLVTE